MSARTRPQRSGILKAFGERVREAFPGAKDAYDFLVPPKDFASWLRNFRLRRGLQQAELAKVLGVSKVTICHYEGNFCKPRPVIQERLRKAFNLNGDFDRFLMSSATNGRDWPMRWSMMSTTLPLSRVGHRPGCLP